MSSLTPSQAFWENAIRLLEGASDLRSLSAALLRIQRTLLGAEPASAAVHLEVAPDVQVTHPLTASYEPEADGERLVIPFSLGEVEALLTRDVPVPDRCAERLRRAGPMLGVVHEKLRDLILKEGAQGLSFRRTGEGASTPFDRLVGRSEAMRRLRSRLDAVARRPSDVLLIGETGTGKELAAQALHLAWKREGPLIPVNCGTLRGEITQSRLFGHEKGAFTGAERRRRGALREANGGTLFLDEVNSLSLPVQAYLLRVLETRSVVPVGSDRQESVDVRVISATNAPLRAAAADGTFRPDLLARIETVTVVLPPLRERPEDIPELSARFLLGYATEHRLPMFTVGPRATALLAAHAWPGNVRELFAVLTRAALHCDESHPTIRSENVRAALHPEGPTSLSSRRRGEERYDAQMKAFERGLLQAALEASGWNVSAAAREMGMTRSRLRNRIRVLAIPGPGPGAGVSE